VKVFLLPKSEQVLKKCSIDQILKGACAYFLKTKKKKKEKKEKH